VRRFLGLIVTGLVIVVSGGAASAQDRTVELKFAHWVPSTHPMHLAATAWSESIEKASNGTIKITIYPAQQLGKAFDHYNMARDGIADISYTNPGYEPGRFPIMGASELPFVFANAKSGSAAFDAWYRKYEAREMKEVHFCLAFLHDPATVHAAHKKVVVPADMRGLKVRPANATIAKFIVMLGGTNVQASAPEARDVLEKGVADAITFPWGSTMLFGIDKVVKYHIDSAFYVTEQVWVLNKAKYDAMSPAQKKVIDDHCTSEWAEKVATPWADFEAAGRDKIKAMAGHEVYPLTAEQLAEWRTAAEPLRVEWAAAVSKAGYDPKAVFEELKLGLSKKEAAY
jgi:TRAP-type C4-dicarboxylate transport system substrate-binding protein